MKLDNVKRDGLARLCAYAGYHMRGGGWVWFDKYAAVGPFDPDGISDGQIMLGCLERVAAITSCDEPVYEIDIEWNRFDCAWDVTIRYEATEYIFGSADLAEAVVGACLQLPEAQPPSGEGSR